VKQLIEGEEKAGRGRYTEGEVKMMENYILVKTFGMAKYFVGESYL